MKKRIYIAPEVKVIYTQMEAVMIEPSQHWEADSKRMYMSEDDWNSNEFDDEDNSVSSSSLFE